MMDYDKLLEELDQYASLDTLYNIRNFDQSLNNLALLGYPLTVRQVITYFSDSHPRPDVLFKLLCFCESYTGEVYIHQLFHALPVLVKKAPIWASIIHRRIFSKPEAYSVYKSKLRFANDDTRDSIRYVLYRADDTDQRYKQHCEALLYELHKLQCAKIELPFNTQKIRDEIKQSCIDAFVSMHLDYYYNKDRVCAMGLVLDPDTFAVTPAINSASHFVRMSECMDRQEAKWLPSHWVCQQTKVDFFSDVKEKIDFQQKSSLKRSISKSAFLFMFFELLVEALSYLYNKKFLYRESLFILHVKGINIGARNIEWAKQMNSAENAKDFEEWANGLNSATANASLVCQ